MIQAVQARLGLSVAGWPLRRKLALALAIPLLLALVLAGLRLQSDLADSRSAARSASQVTVIQPAVDYLKAAEAGMVAAQSDDTGNQGDLIDAMDDITTNAENLVLARDNGDLDDLQTAQVNALLDLSEALRSEAAADLGPATWIAQVRQLESSVSQLITSVNAAQDTPEPRLEQLSQTMSGRLSLAMQQALLETNLAQSTSQELFSEIGVEAAAIDRLAGSVDGAEEETATLRTANTRHAGQIRADSGVDFDGRDASLPYDRISTMLISGVTDTLNQTASDARRNALIAGALTLLMIAAALAIAFLIARSLLDPINRVRDGALAVARHRLPDAVARIRAGGEPEEIQTIDVTTDEEIGQVARAVDDLHRQAIHLASGEAQLRQTVNAMFVTLSRRSTSLVNQQLAQIERLEHDEEDPKRLESLFRLDHLASRMRRTADSLLILADAPNRAAGQFSLTVGEALQAATSGVQDYQRVQILSHLNTRVGDESAADVVHLLTELVDNALTYSPPAEPVRLAAKLAADGVTITVTDSGLGVPAAELEQLNNDLQHGADATPDTARRMGLFVVSRLAERHGITARLVRNPGGGMTATVLLPPSVLPELPQVAAPAAAPAAARPAVPAPAPEVLDTHAIAAPATLSKREARNRTRTEKAEVKVAERAAAAEARAAKKEAELEPLETPVATAAPARPAASPAAPAVAASEPVASEGRPSLESLLPRREPGANIPRTGVDAFLPPETSGATGPLFGKRSEPAVEEPAAATSSDAAADLAPGTEAPVQPSTAQKVARVVPITALASRQRAQAVEDARAAEQTPVEEPVTAEPVTVQEPVTAPVEPARAFDPLSDPLPVAESEPAFEEPVAEPTFEEPVVEVEAPVATSTATEDLGIRDLPRTGAEPARVGGDSPIFKSMRSGWLSGDADEFHETEVERGWEIAEQVAEVAPSPVLTTTGLPRRAPGERLVPGSVTPPTAAKTRDPEAIRRRLQSHTAGVSRGRRAIQTSPQHTEAGPA